MFSLLIDTHGKEMNLVLYKNQEVLKAFNSTYNNQSKMIIPKIMDLLNEGGISINDISLVIVVNGPGSFTGTRIGVTVAKTIAYCLNIPIKSISSLALMAIGNDVDYDYITSIPDNKGYFIAEYDKNNNLIREYSYLQAKEYEDYIKDKNVINDVTFKWDKLFTQGLLVDEDPYNIKPLYIKKIEVEK